MWSLVATSSACDGAGSQPGTVSSVSAVASRVPDGVRFDEATEAYKRFEKACREQDANALWAALAPGGQADVGERMKALYEQASKAEQERLSKLDGEPDLFSPQEYLISQFGKAGSVCPKGEWTLTDKQVYEQLYLMVRHVGEACEGLWFARTDGRVSVFPAGWYEICPQNPAAQVIADVGQRGRKQREEQAKAEQPKGELVTPEQVKQVYEVYTKACKAKDMDALWALVPESKRERFSEKAAKLRDRKGGALLREDGWKGEISGFDGRALFEFDADIITFCPNGAEWGVLAASTVPLNPGWLVVKATGSDRERCDGLEVTREGPSLRIYPRNIWIPKCPPEVSLSELVSAQ